jgi:uncharacterized OB-fold protein
MTEPILRPLPQPDPDTEPYWTAARDGVLLLQRCVAAGHVQFFPRPVCVTCAADVASFEASGRGEVHTFTVVHKSGAPPFNAMTPFVLALVQLDEGPRMMTNIVGCAPDAVTIGMRVRVTFERQTDDISLPMWRPEADG